MRQYLDGSISDHDLEEFIKHIKSCPACYGDLEIYYVMDMAQNYLKMKAKNPTISVSSWKRICKTSWSKCIGKDGCAMYCWGPS